MVTILPNPGEFVSHLRYISRGMHGSFWQHCGLSELAHRRAAIAARVLSLLLAVVVVLVGAGCDSPPPEATPAGAVRQFVEIVGGFTGNERDAQALFQMLSARAKKNLVMRAKRHSAATGKKIEPWTMLVEARTAQRFLPQAYHAKTVGSYAMVDVVGVHSKDRAQIPCVLEKDVWRVDLSLPELPPAVRRTEY